jgi:hypothetical protein
VPTSSAMQAISSHPENALVPRFRIADHNRPVNS